MPTWVAAVGTVGALSTALFQIRTERQYRLQTEAVDRAERHQAQARLISAFVGPVELTPQRDDLTRSWIYLINGSEEPVYRLLVGIVFMQGTAPQTTERWFAEILKDHPARQRPFTTLSILPPGRWRVSIKGEVGGGTGDRRGAEIAFTDRADAHWIRRASGKLEELPEEPLKYFEKWDLHGPHDLVTPLAMT